MPYQYKENSLNISQKLVGLLFGEVSPQMLFDKSSTWHHACHQKFSKRLFRKSKKETEDKGKTGTKVSGSQSVRNCPLIKRRVVIFF